MALSNRAARDDLARRSAYAGAAADIPCRVGFTQLTVIARPVGTATAIKLVRAIVALTPCVRWVERHVRGCSEAIIEVKPK